MNPVILEKLQTLIRSTFATEAEITATSLSQLEYLTAVLKEAGRTYPALPSGTPAVPYILPFTPARYLCLVSRTHMVADNHALFSRPTPHGHGDRCLH